MTRLNYSLLVGILALLKTSASAAADPPPAPTAVLVFDSSTRTVRASPFDQHVSNWGEADFDAVAGALTIGGNAVTPSACPAAAEREHCFLVSISPAKLSDAAGIPFTLTTPAWQGTIHLPPPGSAPADALAPPRDSPPATPATAALTDEQKIAAYQEVMDRLKLPATGEAGNFYDRDKDYAVVFYDSDGNALFMPIPEIDEDDTVYIVVVPAGGTTVTGLRIVTCSNGPAVRVGGSAVLTPPARWRANAAPPPPPVLSMVKVQRCSSDQGIKASFQSNQVSHDISITTLPLYRVTLGLSLIYDLAHSVAFSTQTVKGNSVPSIVEDDHVTGPAAVGFVSLRLDTVDMSRPRCANTNPWHCLLRAVNPALGINVTDPINHIYAGLNIEPWPGLGLILGYHFQRTSQLANGYNVGDLLPTGSVPTVMRWENPGTNFNGFVGLNVDGTLLAKILTGFGK
jgi:hypothetical protein